MYRSFIIEARFSYAVALGLFTGRTIVARCLMYRDHSGDLTPSMFVLLLNREIATLDEALDELLAGDGLSDDVRDLLAYCRRDMVEAGPLRAEPWTTMAVWCRDSPDLPRRLRVMAMLIANALVEHDIRRSEDA